MPEFQYRNHFKEFKGDLKQAIEKALTEIGTFVTAEAQMRTPVDTGNLRRSETFEVDNTNSVVHIGSSVPYAEYVEMGTSLQKAQPFLVPAVEENREAIRDLSRKILKESAGGE